MTKKKNPEDLQKPGRKSAYNEEETIKQAVKLCENLGATDKDLAKFFEVNEDTINEWKKVHPEFSESVREAKDRYDTREVESSLLLRAKGMTRIVQKYDSIAGKIVELTEEIIPDPTSIKFWLANRDRDRWRDKQDVEHSGSINLRPVINYGKKPAQ